MNNKRLLLSSISPLIFFSVLYFLKQYEWDLFIRYFFLLQNNTSEIQSLCGWNEEKVFVYRRINYTETSFYKSAQFARSGSRMFPKIVDYSAVCALSMNYHLRYCSPKHFSIFTTVGNSWEFCTRIKTIFGPKQHHYGWWIGRVQTYKQFQIQKDQNYVEIYGGFVLLLNSGLRVKQTVLFVENIN